MLLIKYWFDRDCKGDNLYNGNNLVSFFFGYDNFMLERLSYFYIMVNVDDI